MPIDMSKLITAGDKREAARAARLAALAARRNAAMSSGVSVGGVTVATDDLSQSRITGAALAALLDPGLEVRWTTPEGVVTLDAPAILTIARAVRDHVQACFDREAALIPLVAGAAEPAGVDIGAGWPEPAGRDEGRRDASRAAR